MSGIKKKISPHTLRHTAVTWLMQQGVDPWEAAGYPGMSEQMLRAGYGHHHPDFMRNAADRITPEAEKALSDFIIVRNGSFIGNVVAFEDATMIGREMSRRSVFIPPDMVPTFAVIGANSVTFSGDQAIDS